MCVYGIMPKRRQMKRMKGGGLLEMLGLKPVAVAPASPESPESTPAAAAVPADASFTADKKEEQVVSTPGVVPQKRSFLGFTYGGKKSKRRRSKSKSRSKSKKRR